MRIKFRVPTHEEAVTLIKKIADVLSANLREMETSYSVRNGRTRVLMNLDDRGFGYFTMDAQDEDYQKIRHLVDSFID